MVLLAQSLKAVNTSKGQILRVSLEDRITMILVWFGILLDFRTRRLLVVCNVARCWCTLEGRVNFILYFE